MKNIVLFHSVGVPCEHDLYRLQWSWRWLPPFDPVFFFWWKFCCFSTWVLFSPNPLRLGQAYSLLITNPPAVFNTQADSWWWPLLAQRFTNLTRFLLWKENTCVTICNSLLSYHHEKLSSFSSAVGLSCKQTKLDMRLLKKNSIRNFLHTFTCYFSSYPLRCKQIITNPNSVCFPVFPP